MANASAKSTDCDFIFKVIMIGDQSVGKSNLLLRFTRNQFDSNTRATIGVEYACKELVINKKKIQTQVWDTAGDERFRSVIPLYYRNSEGALLVFDLTEPNSFQHLSKWIEEIHRHASPDASIVLVGNKSDLTQERRITTAQATAFARQLDLSYIETSALNSSNVEQAFISLVTNICQRKMPKTIASAKKPASPLPTSTIPIWSDSITENAERAEPLRLSDSKKPAKKSACC